MDARAWIDSLALPRHAALLRRLVDAVEPDERFRALELQCSVARGVGDELSDLDAGLWVADEDAARAVAPLVRSLGDVSELLDTQLAGETYVFAHFADGVQLDLWAPRVARAKGRAPDAVVLVDKDGLLAEPYEPDAYRASGHDLEEWRFRARLALANLDKYLRRGSLWEARASLEEARAHLLQLHAAAHDVPYPTFGLTSILDTDVPLPDGLERTVAGVDAYELRAGADALAELLCRAGR